MELDYESQISVLYYLEQCISQIRQCEDILKKYKGFNPYTSLGVGGNLANNAADIIAEIESLPNRVNGVNNNLLMTEVAAHMRHWLLVATFMIGTAHLEAAAHSDIVSVERLLKVEALIQRGADRFGERGKRLVYIGKSISLNTAFARTVVPQIIAKCYT